MVACERLLEMAPHRLTRSTDFQFGTGFQFGNGFQSHGHSNQPSKNCYILNVWGNGESSFEDHVVGVPMVANCVDSSGSGESLSFPADRLYEFAGIQRGLSD